MPPKPDQVDVNIKDFVTHSNVKNMIEQTKQSKDIDTVLNNRDVPK